MVTVIITTYKRELELLLQAVKSVKQQTYSDIELIVVDDNGRGNEYQKRNQSVFENDGDVTYIVNETNSGAQYSRNVGILYAQGDFIAFLDDDDVWIPDKIEKQLVCFDDDQVGLVYCNGYFVQDNDFDHLTVYRQGSSEGVVTFDNMLYDDCVGTTTQAIVRKKCFASVGIFDPDMPARQDYEMWIRISRCWQLKCVNEFLFYHRIHSGEQISKSNKKTIEGNCRILQKYRDDYKTRPYAKAKRMLRISVTYVYMKQYAVAILWFLRAFFRSPKCTVHTYKNRQVLR